MSRAKRCVQWCVIGLLVSSTDIFSQSETDLDGTDTEVDSSKGLVSCSEDGFGNGDEREFNFDFSDGSQGWTGDFADYLLVQESSFRLVFDPSVALLPDLDPNDQGLFISGNNINDNLFMFVKRRVTGLEPNERYLIDFNIEIGSEAGDDCIGAGGAPAITLKAGASAIEPLGQPGTDGFVRMNIDKGIQGASGANALVLGDTGVDVDCDDPVFESQRLATPANVAFETATDENGAVWLIVGTDSGFEGVTRLFYTNIEARFESR